MSSENYDTVCCGCGKHFGLGNLTPEMRAKSYRRMIISGVANPLHFDWLRSFEEAHGAIYNPTNNIPSFIKSNPIFQEQLVVREKALTG